jgi:DNA-binding CsgD family transcriptional regulator
MIRNCWMVAFSPDGTMRDLHPPPASPWTESDVIGKPAWHSLSPQFRDGFKEALAKVITQRMVVIWNGTDAAGMTWRAWLFPLLRVGLVGGIVRRWPAAVVLLNERERQICACIAAGLLSKQIAHNLGLNASTVNNRRSAIAHKLGLHPSALAGWCGLHEEWLS